MWKFRENVADQNAKPEVKGLWNIYENEEGETSLKIHEPKTVWQSCPPEDHYFEITDSPKRELTCTKCGTHTTFIVGLQVVVDGKIVSLR